MARVAIPTFSELLALQETGKTVGYRGIYIYLRYREILTALRDVEMSNVLSIGCGYGIFDRLLPSTINFFGVDIAPAQIEYAQTWARHNRPTFNYQTGDFRSLGLARGSFDTIFLSEVIEHIPESEIPGFIATIHELLSERGVLLLSVPNKWTARNRVRRLFGLPLVIMDKTHLREYTLSEIRHLVAQYDFDVENFRAGVLYLPLELTLRKLIAPQSPLRRAVLSLFPQLASHFIFVLRKRAGNR